jgi:hypothetical protein
VKAGQYGVIETRRPTRQASARLCTKVASCHRV